MDKTKGSVKEKSGALDQNIDRFRQQIESLKTFVMGGSSTQSSIEEFDLAMEELIAEVLGSSSSMLEAYEYAQLGEAGGLVNISDEAPEGAGLDNEREALRQRLRVLESCVADLEARRAQASAGRRSESTGGPTVSEFMSRSIRLRPA